MVDEGLPSIGLALDGCSDPAALYSEFFALITGALERCGAYRPSSLPGRRRTQPLRWSSECDAAIARRRDALKRYIACQTRDERAACRRIDGEVKRFLRRQKHLSFVFFCESIDPSLGLTRIWRTVRSMSSRVVGYRTGRGTDPDSPALEALREELVCPGVPPVEVPTIVDVDDANPMNFPFTARALGVPGRIVNFVNFLTTKRVLYFSAADNSPRVCGEGVPQGGVLSPLLFNLHLRGINEILPVDVRASMYADDLLLYTRQVDPRLALCALRRRWTC